MHLHFHWQLASSIVVLLGIILLSLVLRRVGILSTRHGETFAGVVLNVTLPALIFRTLYFSTIEARLFWIVGIMISAQIACLALAYGAGRWMRLAREKMGALLLTSAFGSSGLLGYALVSQAFPDNPEAMAEAAMISEMAVAPLVFTLGVLVAIHFGKNEIGPAESLKTVRKFLYSPVFVALAAGLLCAAIGMPKPSGAVVILFKGLEVLASANTFLAAMTVGLLLSVKNVRSYLGLIAVACSIKLLVQPLLAWLPMQAMAIPPLHQQVLVIEAAMPAMTLSAVFAKVYGCDGNTTSILLLATNIACIGSLVLVTAVLF